MEYYNDIAGDVLDYIYYVDFYNYPTDTKLLELGQCLNNQLKHNIDYNKLDIFKFNCLHFLHSVLLKYKYMPSIISRDKIINLIKKIKKYDR